MESEKKEIQSVISENFQPPQHVKPKKKRFAWQIQDEGSPKEIYNWRLFMSVFVFGILGSARGYDEGNSSLALVSFKKQFGLSDPNKSEDQLANLKSNISSMVQLGSVGGALIATYSVDKLGRIRALQCACIIWLAGAIIQVTSHSVGQLYAGRLIEGLAIGQTTSIGPSYLSECAPREIRGMCVSIFSGAVYFGIMIAYFANYGTSIHMSAVRNQWVVPTSIKIVLCGLIFILSTLFCIESPRWLLKKNKPDKAVQNLSKLRKLPVDHPYITSEISDINEQVLREKEAVEGSSAIGKIKELLYYSSNRYRLFALGAAAQILGQWSGANAVTIYAPEFFELSGIKDNDLLKMTAVLGVVKFVSAYFSAFFIIDVLGRKKTLFCGLVIQFVTTLYFALFLEIVPEAAVTGAKLTSSQLRASKGALTALFLSGTGWVVGFNNIQYLVGAEVFPLNIRSFAQSLIMVLHFAMQYGNSKAVPKMLISMDNFGAFYFFVGIIAISMFWAWFFIPEIAGRSLESMEDIFNLPWYLIGRKGPELCPDYSELGRLGHSRESFGQLIDSGKIEIAQKENKEEQDLESNHSENFIRSQK